MTIKIVGAFIAIILLSGCQSKFVRADYAYGSQFAASKYINDASKGYRTDGDPKYGLALDGHYLSLMLGVEEPLFSDIRGALMIGPAAFIPTKGPDTEFLSVEARLRFTYAKFKLQPFLQGIASVGFSGRHKWEGEGTRLLFSTGGTIGVALPLGDTWRVDVGYEYYHISNGATIFGSHHPNAGYNSDMIIIGLEHKF